jgi:hypothetical protein
VDVDVRAPAADGLVVRTPRSAIAALDLFEEIEEPLNNMDDAIFAGETVYFEVLAIGAIGTNAFTTAPELDGEQVTVTAYGNYNADTQVGVNEYEKEEIETATATFSGGVATGTIEIEKAGANSPGFTSKALQVVLTAELTDDDNIASGAPPVAPSDFTVDTVDVRSGDPAQLIIGKDPLSASNLIVEVDTWFVIDDNSSTPSTNDMAVFLADEFGNPTSNAVAAVVTASLTGDILDAPATLSDNDGDIPEAAAQRTAWSIGQEMGRSDDLLDGIATKEISGGDNQQELTGCDGSSCRGEPLEATFTVASAGMDPDTATVWLVRADPGSTGASVTGDSYASGAVNIDLHLDSDKPDSLVVAGDMLTLYITDASGSEGNPTTSEIVQYKDGLVIMAYSGANAATDCSDSMTALLIGPSFASATDTGLVVSAPAPDTTTKHIEVEFNIYSDCSQLNDDSVCFLMDDISKGLEDIPLYANYRGPAKCEPTVESVCKITLPSGLKAADDDLDTDPIVITSAFEVGSTTLLLEGGVATADAYDNVVNSTPAYGANSDVGIALSSSIGTTITFDAADVGETATVTVAVSGVCSRDLEIENIVATVATGALTCMVEGPALSPPGGETIIQVEASKAFSDPTTRNLLVSIDTATSVTDAELRNFFGGIEGTSATSTLDTDTMHRLVVSAPAAGTVTIEVGDTTSGVTDPLDTGTCTVTFAVDDEVPVATIAPADGSSVLPTAEIVITITDNIGVSLGLTSYTVDRNGSDYLPSLDCVTAGDGSSPATITCAGTIGGLIEGSYEVEVMPVDLAGNEGTTETSAFTVSSVICTNTVTISPAGATVCPLETETFTAATDCDGTSVTETYTWSTTDTAGTVDGGVYTAGSAAGSYTVTATGDTTGESAAATVTVTEGEVTISPSTATVAGGGGTQQFSATTSCSVTETYTYTISTNNSGGTIVAGLYTAGNTLGTDTVTATGDTTGDTDDATVTVTGVEKSISVTPSAVWRSRWVPLPSLMFIEGTSTSFAFLSTNPVYTPAGAVIALPAMVWSATSMWQLILVNPAWLSGITDETPQTVTVTVDGVSDTITVELLPFILDE